MNRFIFETELDDLGRPVRRRVRLMTYPEIMRAVKARANLRHMLALGLAGDDDTVVGAAIAELEVNERGET